MRRTTLLPIRTTARQGHSHDLARAPHSAAARCRSCAVAAGARRTRASRRSVARDAESLSGACARATRSHRRGSQPRAPTSDASQPAAHATLEVRGFAKRGPGRGRLRRRRGAAGRQPARRGSDESSATRARCDLRGGRAAARVTRSSTSLSSPVSAQAVAAGLRARRLRFLRFGRCERSSAARGGRVRSRLVAPRSRPCGFRSS